MKVHSKNQLGKYQGEKLDHKVKNFSANNLVAMAMQIHSNNQSEKYQGEKLNDKVKN